MRLITLALALTLAAAPALACGVERWPVKVGTDRSVAHVNTKPIPTTIAKLGSIIAPHDPDRRHSSRFAPTELHVYRIRGVLTLIKKERDRDYHLVVTDARNRRVHMIVESPNPACAKGSRFLGQIVAVRKALDRRFGHFRQLRPNIPVMVSGVAFFDKIHGQTGVAPNGIELHPILALRFR